MPDLMIIAGGPKGAKPNPFAKKKAAPGGLPSPEPVGGRPRGPEALAEAGYHGAEETCARCGNFKDPDICRLHKAKCDPDFGHCNDFEGGEEPEMAEGGEMEEEIVA